MSFQPTALYQLLGWTWSWQCHTHSWIHQLLFGSCQPCTVHIIHNIMNIHNCIIMANITVSRSMFMCPHTITSKTLIWFVMSQFVFNHNYVIGMYLPIINSSPARSIHAVQFQSCYSSSTGSDYYAWVYKLKTRMSLRQQLNMWPISCMYIVVLQLQWFGSLAQYINWAMNYVCQE